MIRIFRYEMKRLLWNKVFFGILAVLLAYGYLTLKGTVIRGIAHTAPFSPWSFGYYLSQLLPVLCLGELIFVRFFVSKEECRVAVLTSATPAEPRRYARVRCCAVLLATFILVICVIALAGGFVYSLFHTANFGSWVLPAVITLLPPLALCLGLGWTLGRLHAGLMYAVMALQFLLAFLPLPQELSFSLMNFYTEYPHMLPTLDPSFSAPVGVLAGRFVILLIGVLAPVIFAALKKLSKHS